MDLPIPDNALKQLKVFVQLLQKNPEILNKPDLSFFKDFIESLGGKVPPAPKSSEPKATDKSGPKFSEEPTKPEEPEIESEESDVELDNTGVIGEIMCGWVCYR